MSLTGSTIGISLTALIAIFCLISAIIGLFRGLKKTLGSTIVIAISAIISFIVTVALCRPTQDGMSAVADKLLESMQGDQFKELISTNAMMESMNYYASFIAAPFVFLALFIVLRFIIGIVMRILMKIIPIFNRIPKGMKRLGGLVIGIVNGFALMVIFTMPFLGLFDVANVVVSSIPETNAVENISGDSSIEELDVPYLLDVAVNQGGGKILLNCGGRTLYTGLTSAEYKGEKVTLKGEAEVYAEMIPGIIKAMAKTDVSDKISGVFDALIYGVDNSAITRDLVAGTVSTAAQSWQKGESFLGISKDKIFDTASLPSAYDIEPMVDTMIDILAKENNETISQDLTSISDFVVEMNKSGFFTKDVKVDSVVETLSKEGTLSGILGTLDKNQNMLPLIDEVNRLCIRLVASPDCLNLPKESASDSDVVSVDDVISHMVSYKDIPESERHNESIKIESVMIEISGSFDGISSASHASELMAVMGSVLDAMNDTTVYGTRSAEDDNSATAVFLVAVMQSESVSDSIGLTAAQMKEFADTINKGSKDASYAEISATVANTFDVLENINSGVSSQEQVEKLINNLTPTTAGVMKDITTPALMQNYGVKEEHAEKSSNAIGTLFGNMANYTENHPIQEGETQEEYDNRISEEAKATDKIITLAIKANEDIDAKEALFNTEGGEGALEMSAYDIIDTFVASTVATDTVTDLVEGTDESEGSNDPLGVRNGLLESDKDEMTNALNQYREDNKDNENIEDLDAKLSNIGALFGIEYTPAN